MNQALWHREVPQTGWLDWTSRPNLTSWAGRRLASRFGRSVQALCRMPLFGNCVGFLRLLRTLQLLAGSSGWGAFLGPCLGVHATVEYQRSWLVVFASSPFCTFYLCCFLSAWRCTAHIVSSSARIAANSAVERITCGGLRQLAVVQCVNLRHLRFHSENAPRPRAHELNTIDETRLPTASPSDLCLKGRMDNDFTRRITSTAQPHRDNTTHPLQSPATQV